MSFPTISQYKDALRTPDESFRTLTYLTPVAGAFGDFYFSSGNFAVVFKMQDTRDNSFKALKCFIREQDRRKESLVAISAYLSTIKNNYIAQYQYLDEELWVENADYPVLIMDWVEGVTLGEKVKHLCATRDTAGLKHLSIAFAEMALQLLAQEWAHGDLKHDNIIVRPDNSLVLVDYDGCFVPIMAGQQAREIGSPSYRHPQRNASHFDRHIDDFSILVIFLSLQALADAPDLHTQHNNGENIVLTTADFNKNSPLKQTLRDSADDILRGGVALLDFTLAGQSGRIFGLNEGFLMPFFEKNKAILESPREVVLDFPHSSYPGVIRLEVNTDIKQLDISGLCIGAIPTEIGQLKNLTTLILQQNYLGNLPTEIGQLTNLTTLDLTYNELTSLPAEIGQLKNLATLDLTYNELTSLPAEIGQLKNLTSLDLSDNELTSLPVEIGQLKNLIELSLGSNKIDYRLRRRNQLTSLPTEIGQVTNLTSLDLSWNRLESLTAKIGQLTNLTSLDLGINALTSLPAEIGQLTNLTYLNLSQNQLTSLPAEIGQLTNLTYLDLGCNELTSLPAEIGQLKNLKMLYLRGSIEHLETFYLRGNNISSIEKKRIEKLLPNCKFW